MTLVLDPLNGILVNSDGTPTVAFQVYWQKTIDAIAAAYTSLEEQLEQIQEALDTATAAGRELARLNSYPNPTNVLTGTDEATGASITVAAHIRVYPVQGSIDVPDVAIPAPVTLTTEADGVTGIVNSTQYSVYYDDTTLADTTPAYKAVKTATSHDDAQPGAAAGRHFVGVVTTPADGAGSTSGSGGAPPGGGGGTVLP